MKLKILIVCLGNICRSPTAHAIFATLRPSWHIESAGTCAEVGNSIDSRSLKELHRQGIVFSHTSRQLTREDILYYDYIFVSDAKRLRDVLHISPPQTHKKIMLLGESDIPDPYYFGNFESVFTLIYHACQKRIAQIESGEI
jgi:protein-tyrosine phosphatase